MKKLEKFNRALLFSICSAIGILALSLATLGPELKNLYKIKSATKQAEQNNGKIEQLLEDHEVLIGRISKDPEMLKRIAPLTLGEKTKDANQPDVKMTADTLDRAKEALAESSDEENPKVSEQEVPAWLQRATLDESRMVLYVAGGGLVLVSFVCFGAKKEKVTSGKSA